MTEITLQLDEKIIQQLNHRANQEKMTPNDWLTQIIQQQLATDWSPEIKALAGSWADFPSAEDLRENISIDSSREPL